MGESLLREEVADAKARLPGANDNCIDIGRLTLSVVRLLVDAREPSLVTVTIRGAALCSDPTISCEGRRQDRCNQSLPEQHTALALWPRPPRSMSSVPALLDRPT